MTEQKIVRKLVMAFSTEKFVKESEVAGLNCSLIKLEPYFVSLTDEYEDKTHSAGSRHAVTLISNEDKDIVATNYLKQVAIQALGLQELPEELIELLRGTYEREEDGSLVFVIPVVIVVIDAAMITNTNNVYAFMTDVDGDMEFNQDKILCNEDSWINFADRHLVKVSTHLDHAYPLHFNRAQALFTALQEKNRGQCIAYSIQPVDAGAPVSA